jgi:hypothetical protein
LALMGRLTECIVAMEACCGAHHLARQIMPLGQGRRHLAGQMPALFADERSPLSPRMQTIAQGLWREWQQLEREIDDVSAEIDSIRFIVRPLHEPDSNPSWRKIWGSGR